MNAREIEVALLAAPAVKVGQLAYALAGLAQIAHAVDPEVVRANLLDALEEVFQ